MLSIDTSDEAKARGLAEATKPFTDEEKKQIRKNLQRRMEEGTRDAAGRRYAPKSVGK